MVIPVTMPRMRALDAQVPADILAYVKTLPKKTLNPIAGPCYEYKIKDRLFCLNLAIIRGGGR